MHERLLIINMKTYKNSLAKASAYFKIRGRRAHSRKNCWPEREHRLADRWEQEPCMVTKTPNSDIPVREQDMENKAH